VKPLTPLVYPKPRNSFHGTLPALRRVHVAIAPRPVVGGNPWPWRTGGSTQEKTGPDTVWRCRRLAPSTTLSLPGTTWCTRSGKPVSGGMAVRCHCFWPVKGVRRLTACSTPPLGSGPQALGLAALGFDRHGLRHLPSCGAARRQGGRTSRTSTGLLRRGREGPCRSLGELRHCACLRQRLPHLLSENDIRCVFEECFRCIRPRGGCVISMRDYGVPPSPGTAET
jgi:hypothetical protein